MAARPHLVICALIAVAAGLTGCRRQSTADRETEPPIPVTAEAVVLGDIRGVVSATGVVNALPGAEFTVTAPEPARILEISKTAGDRVKSGDVLVRFEFPSARAEAAARAAAIKAAEIRLQSARLAQGRVHGLVERGAASRNEAEQADREVVDAEAELADSRKGETTADALEKRSVVRAPFDGVVAERLHGPGDSVGRSTNDVILRLSDPRQVEITATVSIKDVTRFTVGATARAIAEQKAAVELLRVASRPEPDAGATTVSVRLTFQQPTELPSGSQVAVEIEAEQRSNVPVVPAIAVVKDSANNAALFLVSGNQAKKRAVTTGLVDAERIEIRSGVKAGELVITQGQSNLKDGSAITMSQ